MAVFSGVLEKENVEYLEMPYQGEDNSISMYVFLPLNTHATAVDDFIINLSAETIQKAMTGRKQVEVDVEIPKMSLERSYGLNGVSF